MLENLFSQKTILVTGAGGFIGSHLTEKLLSLGAKVTGVDNFITGSNENVEAIRASQPGLIDSFTFIEADVNQPPETYLPNEMCFDTVFHLASPASPKFYQKFPRETYLVNSWATHQLLDYLLTTNPKTKFLFASTSEIYGDPQVHPQPESYWGNVNPNGVRSCYDEAKRLGESICGVYQRDFNLDVRIVRIFNTYGPRMDINDGRVVPNLIKHALAEKKLPIYGDGTQTRSYCYVDDMVEGLLLVMSSEQANGETVNLGNPDEYTVLQTAQLINKIIRGKLDNENNFNYLPLPKDDPTRRKPDINKAINSLNWQPKIPFEDGLIKTIEFFRSAKAV